jgi:hypothetical protein
MAFRYSGKILYMNLTIGVFKGETPVSRILSQVSWWMGLKLYFSI